ncbi:hypothetical protein [Rhodohalobacter barkolensis]|nr:hypothetical protein [Rhodohalobacter barkolensis]
MFYFNRNQSRYVDRINQSIKEYSKPIVVEENGEVALVFKEREIGQTLHIFDGDYEGAALIGAVMYVRDSEERITIVHMALHEECSRIYKEEGVNIVGIVMHEVLSIFKKMKGVSTVRIYYIDKEFPLGKLLKENSEV